MPSEGYRLFVDAKKDISHYLMNFHNDYRPHQANNGMSSKVQKKDLNNRPEILDHYSDRSIKIKFQEKFFIAFQ